MKKTSIFTLVLLVFSTTFFVNCGTIQPDNPLIEYTGRIDFSNPLKPKFSYSGVSVRACFQGTSVSVILNDDGNQNYYNVILDKAVISRLQTKAGQNTYILALSLKDSIHEIEIFKLTEDWLGKTQFCGFVLDNGKTLVNIPNKRELLIEFIGNSITCGYGNEGKFGDAGFSAKTENHYLTYAAITSRSFKARHFGVCKSGKGIYRNYDGPIAGNSDCMPNYYQRIFFDKAEPIYNFAQKPDLICIDLGTNDFSTEKGDSALYVHNYLRFIDTIQLKNSSTDILCLLGPMMGGNTLIRVRKYIKFIVDSANQKNNGKVYFFEMSQQTGSLGMGSDTHPTVAQHLKNAKELISYIATLKSWQVSPQTIIGTTKLADEIILEFNTGMQDVTGNFNGFSVNSDNAPVSITSVSLDLTDKSKIHIFLAKSLAPGQNIIASYKPGTVEGINNNKLDGFSAINITNNLTPANLTKCVADSSGLKITLTFDKVILKPVNFDGILLFDSNNSILPVNTFNLNSKNIEITLLNKIRKTDSVFLTITSGVFSTDKVQVLPVTKYPISNNSLFTSLENIQTEKLIFFPNPAHNKIIFYRFEGVNSIKAVAGLYDLQGKLILSKVLINLEGSVDLNAENIQSGNYILKINSLKKIYASIIRL
jgi:hypothetical protein